MSGSLIKEYLIGFGFQLDEGSLDAARAALDSIVSAAREIEGQVLSLAHSAQFALSSISPTPVEVTFEVEDISEKLSAASVTLAPLALNLDASALIKSAAEAKRALSDIDVPALALELNASAFFASLRAVKARAEDVNATEVIIPVAGDFSGLEAAADAFMSSLKAVSAEAERAQAAVKSLAGAGRSFSGLASSARAAAKGVSSAIKSEMSAAAAAVNQYVGKMKSALSSLSTSIAGASQPTQKFSIGGVVEKETRATIGEDGREYVIPVTKPDRAIPLLKAAMEDLNLGGQALTYAANQLSQKSPPVYAAQPTIRRETVQNSTVHNTVSAPATINVYGRDAESIAQNVERNQELLLIRNIKGVYAQ